METRELWKKRSFQFWWDLMPYLNLIMRSGLGALLLLGIPLFFYFYTGWLNQLSQQYPGFAIAILALTPVLSLIQARTFLKPADLVYLLPLERKMRGYFRDAFIYSFFMKLAVLVPASAAVWPLYVRTAADRPVKLAAFLAVFIVMEIFHLSASWTESRMVSERARLFFRMLRWGLTGLSIWMLFVFEFWKASVFLLLVWLTFVLILRLPDRFGIHWQHLVSLEARAFSRIWMWIGWFTDVPGMGNRPKRRNWASRWADLLSLRRRNTAVYLYAKTWTRTEGFGMTLRLAAGGMLAVIWTPGDLAKSAVWLIFIHIIGIQLSAVRLEHQSEFWFRVYPIPKHLLNESLARFVRSVQIMFAALLMIPYAASLSSVWLLAPAAVPGILLIWYSGIRLLQKRAAP
ncbi:ABC transporter permease [Ferviditalea candida]|uniref:ABC transporter permease n=1 Tax=Ferviditalea candida TaxID=3108399 RepID=A0ABU5ZDX6_9BACL|nr:ABC transporter permease [Paenibacillaceae bacterium T2]